MGKDILILAEHLEGKLAPSTLELVAKGRELASQSGGVARAALLGHGAGGLAQTMAGYGLPVLHIDDPALAEYTDDGYGQALRSLVESNGPRIVLVAHTAQGYDVAPGLAGAMDLPLASNCIDVRLEGQKLVVVRRLLNEKIQGEFELASEKPYVVTLRPGTAKPAEPAPGGSVIPTPISIETSKIRTVFLGIERPQVSDIDIAAADVIVSAGRGIQKKENLPMVEEFAKLLGGVVGASRPLTDMEWLPKTRQVGQSGKTVRPKLYVACGISGAMQHVAGMKDAGLIVAINTDPSAPIFEVAHVGIVGNVLQILPLAIKDLKG
ncbi:MAG TPA: electron transfer flavoprotein subunit alpha/FixB family protein [Thermoplasmata archaeon]|nr:electron transfer flavoprotein subunit alpha/FixB family protein [Thermoplasmata archaeon]